MHSPPHDRGSGERRRNWFARHPRTSILAAMLALALAADLVLGLCLIRPSPAGLRCLHPYYHHGFLPGVSTTGRWGAREYPMFTDSLGFRDRAPRRVALAPAARRIVVIGDSFVEGMGVDYERTFPALLEKRLGPEVEVLNAGAVSYCPMLYRLKVQYLLEQEGLVFTELVVFIDISDIQDEVNYQSFEPHLPDAVDRASTALRAFLGRHSFFAYTLQNYQRRGGISTAIDPEKVADHAIYFQGLSAYQGEKTQGEVEAGRWEWTIAEPLMEAWGRRGLELAREDMSALVELCRARGIALTVCVYPSPVQILMEDLDSIQVKFWREFAAEKGVAFVDLFPSFVGKEAGRPRGVYKKYFIEGDVHWNEAGHERVAEELARRL